MNFVIIFWIALVLISIYAWVDIIKDKESCCRRFEEVDEEYIDSMSGREFEEYCAYIFKNTEKYKSVELTQYKNDGGKDIILTDKNDRKIFVECKRYSDNATVTENFMIGREICQKLVGAMMQNGIWEGLIITTGNVHQNAWDYINELEQNSNVKLDIITRDELFQMIKNTKKKNELDAKMA